MMNSMPSRPEVSGAVTRYSIVRRGAQCRIVERKVCVVFGRPNAIRHLSGAVDGIGRDQGRFHAIDETGSIWVDEARHVSNQEEAIELVLSSVERQGTGWTIVAVGHRIVHGGPDCDCPELVTAEA